MFIIAPIISEISKIWDSWQIVKIVIHLGINPVNGGIPPNERSNKGIIICIIGVNEFNLLNCLLFVCIELFIIIKIGEMIMLYIIK